SSGVATAEAMVSGFAPGRAADTWTVGKSTFGRASTGRASYPRAPARTTPTVRRVVITGRRMNGAEMVMRKERQRQQDGRTVSREPESAEATAAGRFNLTPHPPSLRRKGEQTGRGRK